MIRRILTRTVLAAETKLTTLARLKADLGVTSTDSDASLGDIIDRCSSAISAYVGGASSEIGDVTIGRETVSEALYGMEGQTDLILGRTPIGDITSIDEDGSTIARLNDDETPNTAFTYLVNKPAAMIWKMSGHRPAHFCASAITVIYTAGWILPGQSGRTLPATIEDACLLFCRSKLDQVLDGQDLSGPLTLAQIENLGKFEFAGTAKEWRGGIPGDIADMLDRYKTPIFA